jgi:putative flippase GtrA
MWNRWMKFNAVGMAGVGVQLAALWLFTRVCGLHYVAATVLAVETAVLHNFVWHEVWTWAGMPKASRMRRLVRFHAANGFVSIVVNSLLTAVFKEIFGMPLLGANLAATGACAMLNFAIAYGWVFREVR